MDGNEIHEMLEIAYSVRFIQAYFFFSSLASSPDAWALKAPSGASDSIGIYSSCRSLHKETLSARAACTEIPPSKYKDIHAETDAFPCDSEIKKEIGYVLDPAARAGFTAPRSSDLGGAGPIARPRP